MPFSFLHAEERKGNSTFPAHSTSTILSPSSEGREGHTLLKHAYYSNILFHRMAPKAWFGTFMEEDMKDKDTLYQQTHYNEKREGIYIYRSYEKKDINI